MARKPSDKPRSGENSGVGAIDLDEEQQQVLFFQHKSAFETMLSRKKKADADFKNACKLAKSELGEHAVDQIKVAIALEQNEDGELALKNEIESKLRVARWVGASVGTQFEMFNGPDRTPAADRAYDEGRRAGMKGDAARPPHSPETEQYRRWMEGHADGNAALARKGFKPTAPEEPGESLGPTSH